MTSDGNASGTRPRSITRFEQLWFASTILWAVGTRLAWNRVQNTIARQLESGARADANVALVADLAQWVNLGFVVVVTLVLWYLVARRASVVAMWLVVLAAGWSAVRFLLTLYTLATSANPHPLSQGSFLLSAALTAAAAAMLFRDDARAWFGEAGEEEEPVV